MTLHIAGHVIDPEGTALVGVDVLITFDNAAAFADLAGNWDTQGRSGLSVSTDAVGAWSWTVPFTAIDPSNATCSITLPNGVRWSGVLPLSHSGTLSLKDLKDTYAWGLVSTPSTPVVSVSGPSYPGVTGDGQGGLAIEGGVTATRLEIDLPAPLAIQQPTGGGGETWQGIDPNDGGALVVGQSFNADAGGLFASASLWLQIDASVPLGDYISDFLYVLIAPDLDGAPDFDNAQWSNPLSFALLNASGFTRLNVAGFSPALAPGTTNWVLLYIQNNGAQAYPAFLAIDADTTDVATAISTDGGTTFSTAPHHAFRFSVTLSYPAVITGPLTVTGLGAFPHGINVGAQNSVTGNLATGEGYAGNAAGFAAHVEGENGTASGDGSHAQNFNTVASGPYSDASGNTTIASGPASQAGGNESESSGENSVTEGRNNKATALNTHGMGHRALASLTNELAHASSYDGGNGHDTHGNAQYSRLVGRVETPDATPAAITLDGGEGAFPIPMIDGQTWQVLAQVSGTRHDTPGTVATFLIKGAVACAAGTARLVGTPTVETWHDAGANAWAATLAVSGNQLEVLVTGAAGATIYWFGVMHIARIANSA